MLHAPRRLQGTEGDSDRFNALQKSYTLTQFSRFLSFFLSFFLPFFMLLFRFVFVPPFLSLSLGVREYMPPNYMIAVHTYHRLPISLSCLRVWPVRRVS